MLKARSESERIENDFSWLIKNTSLLQDKYCGKWIAVVNQEITAIADSAVEAYNKSKKECPGKEALLDFVPRKELLILYSRS